MFTSIPYYVRRVSKLWYGSNDENEETTKANVIVKKILHIYGELASRKDLQPSAELNELYLDLVHICTEPVTEQFSNLVLENPRVTKILNELRNFCAQIEFNTEKYWSIEAAGNEDSTEQDICARIQKIPHIEVNTELIREELSAIRLAEQKPVEKIAIIGSGPLPLTGLGLIGLLFNSPTNIRIMNIDRELDALETAQNLCQRLGDRAKGMEFLRAEAGSALDLIEYDAVYLAILVGNTQQEKEILLKNVTSRMRPGALLIVRGTTKLKRLMYSIFDPTTESVAQLLNVELVVHPRNHYIVDSVIIGRVK